jgi:hypothetical protein
MNVIPTYITVKAVTIDVHDCWLGWRYETLPVTASVRKWRWLGLTWHTIHRFPIRYDMGWGAECDKAKHKLRVAREQAAQQCFQWLITNDNEYT